MSSNNNNNNYKPKDSTKYEKKRSEKCAQQNAVDNSRLNTY